MLLMHFLEQLEIRDKLNGKFVYVGYKNVLGSILIWLLLVEFYSESENFTLFHAIATLPMNVYGATMKY